MELGEKIFLLSTRLAVSFTHYIARNLSEYTLKAPADIDYLPHTHLPEASCNLQLFLPDTFLLSNISNVFKSELRSVYTRKENCIYGEIKNRINSENTCYHSVFCHIAVRCWTTSKRDKHIILPIVLCGCEILCRALREGHRLTVFDNWVLRRIFGPNKWKITEEWQNCMLVRYIIWRHNLHHTHLWW